MKEQFPNQWMRLPLSELIIEGDKINYGVVQPGNDLEEGVPLVRVGDFVSGAINLSNLKRISPDIDKKHKKSRLVGDEILIACVGSIGAVGLANPSLVGANIARAVARIRCSDLVFRKYLYWYLRSPEPQRFFNKETRTVSQPTLNIREIEQTLIPLPPIDEQRCIAAILDRADAVRQKRQEAIALTEELLRSAFLEMFGDSLTHLKGCEYIDDGSLNLSSNIKQLDKIADVIDCKHRTPIYTETGYPVVRPRDVREEGINFKNCLKTSFEEYADLTEKRKPQKGDIVYSRNATFGVASLIEAEREFAIGQDVCLIVTRDLNPVFLYYLLNSHFVRQQLENVISGSTFKRINLSEIRKLKVLIPGKSLQDSFANFYYSQQKMIANLRLSLLESENLFNSLLQKAFRGEL